jgi:hypothetical protein
MRSATALLSAALFCLCVFALAGCETGRANKLHSPLDVVADVTTTPHPDLKFASISTGIPPVPGSPTAAGPDGTQPLKDSEARVDPGAEKGLPIFPRSPPVDRFIRQ